MTTVALELSVRGVEVHVPEDADSRCLTVAGLKGRGGNVHVDDDGTVVVECWPDDPADADPAMLAIEVATILGSGRDGWLLDGKAGRSGTPVARIVGPAVRAAGLAAEMVLYPDYDHFDVLTLVIATNPSRPDLGEVRIGDDGVLIWECLFPPGTRPGDIACRTGDVAMHLSGMNAGMNADAAMRQAARGNEVPGKNGPP
jgi:hypothetical protein